MTPNYTPAVKRLADDYRKLWARIADLTLAERVALMEALEGEGPADAGVREPRRPLPSSPGYCDEATDSGHSSSHGLDSR